MRGLFEKGALAANSHNTDAGAVCQEDRRHVGAFVGAAGVGGLLQPKRPLLLHGLAVPRGKRGLPVKLGQGLLGKGAVTGYQVREAVGRRDFQRVDIKDRKNADNALGAARVVLGDRLKFGNKVLPRRLGLGTFAHQRGAVEGRLGIVTHGRDLLLDLLQLDVDALGAAVADEDHIVFGSHAQNGRGPDDTDRTDDGGRENNADKKEEHDLGLDRFRLKSLPFLRQRLWLFEASMTVLHKASTSCSLQR